MKKKDANKEKLPFWKNKYIVISIGFFIWMMFLDNYSFFDHRFLDNQIDELNENKWYYQQEIAKDKHSIKLLKNEGQIEKYAREKYFMKKDSEDVYIVEFKDDTLVSKIN
ncbi:septum formation initiator [Flavobacterium branchiophilum NBRC 15030 = ATCC 35035]|uniref:Septum formation initiator n=1 Tax=Flavobacterium branchiophilum TaxID=55197 RepID=A0A543G5B3_9FLAO|nr:septum formation initiator family protein [Flavobacterium branchiophilum]OXA78062.1 septum formation initiator [Flavobacterium branchiophilum NBRC 15030 = ATCC 35035]TQM41262.1 septum formation initiator [Flavobacterium branchiophilum]GEM54864.1 hypothetical protein FB1_10850 [Flavobacterium branchiophilum NBRC 15030 = ATCC 35035]